MPWFDPPQIFSPRLRRSARTASMPFLSIVRRPLVETRSFTQRFSGATQKRRSWRLGRKRRRVLFIACETLLPLAVRLPVTWQTRDMVHLWWVADRSAWGLSLARKAFGPAGGVDIHARRAIRERCRGMRRLGPAGPGIALPG